MEIASRIVTVLSRVSPTNLYKFGFQHPRRCVTAAPTTVGVEKASFSGFEHLKFINILLVLDCL